VVIRAHGEAGFLAQPRVPRDDDMAQPFDFGTHRLIEFAKAPGSAPARWAWR